MYNHYFDVLVVFLSKKLRFQLEPFIYDDRSNLSLPLCYFASSLKNYFRIDSNLLLIFLIVEMLNQDDSSLQAKLLKRREKISAQVVSKLT